MTLYDLTNPEVANGSDYEALRAKGSEDEKRILSKLRSLNRRVYSFVHEFTNPEITSEASSLPPKYAQLVAMQIKPENEENYRNWYIQEHFALIAKVSQGYVRGRMFKLSENMQRGEVIGQPPFNYLVVHESTEAPKDIMAAIFTPWMAEVMKSIGGVEVRAFELDHVFKKAE